MLILLVLIDPLICLFVEWLSSCVEEGGERRSISFGLGDSTLSFILLVLDESSFVVGIIEDGIIGKQLAAEGDVSTSPGVLGEERIGKVEPFLEPENFLAVEFTIAVAMLEMVGIGEVNLNVGEVILNEGVLTGVEFVGDIGPIWGMDGIPGTLRYKSILF